MFAFTAATVVGLGHGRADGPEAPARAASPQRAERVIIGIPDVPLGGSAIVRIEPAGDAAPDANAAGKAGPAGKATPASKAKAAAGKLAGKLARAAGKPRRAPRTFELGSRRSTLPDEDAPVARSAPTPRALPAATVRRVIRANADQIEHCHRRAAARGHAASGQITLRFTVLPDGRVDRAVSVETNVSALRTLTPCIAARVRGWRFPAADAPTAASHPFTFQVIR